ncbi:HAD-IC family P-type ATPase [Selenomonas ruminis]|uniref:P-type Cu(+) transporter n=1 Tax=Selenomonas ruminis TaxID=2593411 RepID=A0A5D6W2E5_9FIRM|nr:HAD-IC family P-type ATPase [Selenomonas sp. mPRGC5]TYZ22523.1 cation-translocating P-type ATPase [Selenomonas sp. mPRGC5]
MKKQTSIGYFTVLAVLLAIAMSAYWLSAGESKETASNIFLAIVIAGLPLPLWLAQSLPLARGAAKASKANIRLESPEVLATLDKINALAVSKGGIVTEGKPYVAGLVPAGLSQGTLLGLAASAEREAKHPFGQAIYQAAIARQARMQPLSASNEIPGCGMEALINRMPVRVGKAEWLLEEGVDITADLLTRADQIAQRGQSTVFVANGKYCRGIIVLDDNIPKETTDAFTQLQQQGIQIVMLSGDSRRTANAISKQAGIDTARSELTDQGKAREIKLLQTHGCTVAMIGNGVRDEAAMAEADLRIHLGPLPEKTGDAAHDIDLPENSSIVLENNNLSDFLHLSKLSHKVMDIVQQNRIVALLFWLLLLPPAMGLVKTFGGPFLPPAAALTGQLCASLMILFNSLRA